MTNANAYNFGVDWTVGKKCNIVDAKKKVIASRYEKHVAVDVMQATGAKVIVTGDLFFYKKHTDSNPIWKDTVVACTILNASGFCDAGNSRNTFFNFEHLISASLRAGQSLKNVQIGTVANLAKNGGSHVHYSKRIGAWNEYISYSGALPPKECNDTKTRTGPNFPENFVDPGTPLFVFKK